MTRVFETLATTTPAHAASCVAFLLVMGVAAMVTL
jgi:hypothetical protein